MLSNQPDPTPPHTQQTGNWEGFHEALVRTCNSVKPIPKVPSYKFEFSREASEFNSERFATHGYDLTRVISAEKGTTMEYGSEFR